MHCSAGEVSAVLQCDLDLLCSFVEDKRLFCLQYKSASCDSCDLSSNHHVIIDKHVNTNGIVLQHETLKFDGQNNCKKVLSIVFKCPKKFMLMMRQTVSCIINLS